MTINYDIIYHVLNLGFSVKTWGFESLYPHHLKAFSLFLLPTKHQKYVFCLPFADNQEIADTVGIFLLFIVSNI